MPKIRIQGDEERRNHVYYEFDPSEQPLGVGGMGKVYRGIRCDKRTGTVRDVAIKFLYDDLPEGVIERARREASIRLKSDSLIEMLGFIEIDCKDSSGRIRTRYHVVSEFVDGVGLDNLLEGKTTNHYGRPVPFAEDLLAMHRETPTLFAIRIIRELLSGLMSMHDAGYVHRDIDPSNIMVTMDGHVKLIDFGIAKKVNTLCSFDKQLTSAGQFMGKACYAAPELVLGDVMHQDATTDIYAVGIMLFQMITGRLPFDGPINEVLYKQIHEKLPLKDVPQRAIRKVIEKATDKKQAKRYSSAVEFRVDIDGIFRNELQNEQNYKERLRIETETKKRKEEEAAKRIEEERLKQEQAVRKEEEERRRREQFEREKQERAAKKAEERRRREQFERERQEQAARKEEEERRRREQFERERQEQAARKEEEERRRREQFEREKQEQAAREAEEKRRRREQFERERHERGKNPETGHTINKYMYAILSVCICVVLAIVLINIARKDIPNPSDLTSQTVAAADVSYSLFEVKEMLLDPARSSCGWQELEKLVSKGDYESVYFQSRIFFHSNEDKDVNDIDAETIRQNLGISVDNEKAHSLLLQAVSIKDDDYKSLYELGCDFKSGRRGTPRDIEMAKHFLIKARELAADDAEYTMKIDERLKGLGK